MLFELAKSCIHIQFRWNVYCYCFFLCFFVGIWSWLADKLHFILSHEAGFRKPTILKVHLPFAGLQHMQQCQINFPSIFAQGFLNHRPLSHESSALNTRPRLLAYCYCYCLLLWLQYATNSFIISFNTKTYNNIFNNFGHHNTELVTIELKTFVVDTKGKFHE